MQSQCDQLRHREGILTEMEKSLDGYYNSVKNVLSAAGQGRLKGIVGTVSQVISVQPQYALAIETVLGGALQNLITEDQESAKNAIRHLQYAPALPAGVPAVPAGGKDTGGGSPGAGPAGKDHPYTAVPGQADASGGIGKEWER